MPAVQDMAATLNAFSILQGAGEKPQASSQKKKKNRGKKKGGAGSNNQAAVQDPVPEQLAEETVRSTPEAEVAVEDGFQLAGVILCFAVHLAQGTCSLVQSLRPFAVKDVHLCEGPGVVKMALSSVHGVLQLSLPCETACIVKPEWAA